MSETTIDHLYRVGELVTLDSRAGYSVKAAANFTVLAQLPPVGNDFSIGSNPSPSPMSASCLSISSRRPHSAIAQRIHSSKSPKDKRPKSGH